MVTALRYYRKGDIPDVPGSPCGPDEVRLKVAYCGICGSDEGETMKYTGLSLPVTMGHELSGTVIEVGSAVTSLALGQDVAVNPAVDHRQYGAEPCGPCKTGRYNTCDAMSIYGLSAPGGGFCEEIVVNALNCLALPDGVSLKVGALAEPLSVAHHCAELSGFRPGQTALICGAGPIGLAVAVMLRVIGAAKIIVTEVTESRMAQARKFGVDAVINPLDRRDDQGHPHNDPVLAAVAKLTEDGVDVAFDATGMQSTLDLCIAATKAGGVVFNVAIHERPLQINLNDLVKQEKKLMGGICYTNKDFEAVLRILAERRFNAEEMITSVVPLSNVVDGGFGELMNNKAAHVKILIQPGL
ncbi:chaperonin 10-like protein [Dactylonectria estremocensis]|uniref:Chaperonin 10-like protein n=1 Tax=Dactylonectria estremocensis TaxID=1079267 RepID=A0A9P9E2X4_9HYPO|nr:chaperonin 10-like protein [Dactylonectria estremocensis]